MYTYQYVHMHVCIVHVYWGDHDQTIWGTTVVEGVQSEFKFLCLLSDLCFQMNYQFSVILGEWRESSGFKAWHCHWLTVDSLCDLGEVT